MSVFPEFRIDVPTGCGFLAIILWSTSIAVTRSLTKKLGRLTAAAAITVGAGLLSVAVLGFWPNLLGSLLQRSSLYLCLCGSLFVTYVVVFLVAIGKAVNDTQLLEISLVNYLWPTLSILLSVFLLHQDVSALLIPGTILALGGIFLALTHEAAFSWEDFKNNIATNPSVYALSLLAAISWAFYSNVTALLGSEEKQSGVFIFLPAAGFIILLLRMNSTEQSSWHRRAVCELAYIVPTTLLAYVFWDIAMRQGDQQLILSFSYFTPLLATLFSCLYLAVKPRLKLLLGCIIIVAGSLLSWLSAS